jgi:hypothetical protein
MRWGCHEAVGAALIALMWQNPPKQAGPDLIEMGCLGLEHRNRQRHCGCLMYSVGYRHKTIAQHHLPDPCLIRWLSGNDKRGQVTEISRPY